MRYRIFFERGQLPIELDCGRWEFHPKAQRRLIVWATARSRKAIDLFLPASITVVKDDHGRIVWPNVSTVIARAKSGRPSGVARPATNSPGQPKP